MKKTLFVICLICYATMVFGAPKQPEIDAKLELIAGKWQHDGDMIYVQKVIDLPDMDKDAIFNKTLEFMTNVYKDANEVIQVKEKENGLLVGKGNSSFFVREVFVGSRMKQTVWHIFKAEVKDNKVRITISVSSVNWWEDGVGNISAQQGEYPITACYPIAEDTTKKKRSGYVFYYTVDGMNSLLEKCEGFLIKKDGVTANNDW